ncbi:hypothetical protein ACFCVY_10150 [Streptomyces sp. NPDC056411]|uniref:hypothetical protein n=1 Tax=Streptomyces sp. NPDC056411 TaxID=3345813 RepID=UPI0035DA68E9
MPLTETEWDLVTTWAQDYLLDTTDPHAQLAQYGFPAPFVSALPLTRVSADNARSLVHASRAGIEGQLRLVEALTTVDRLAVLPEIGKARDFLARLREDFRAHTAQDTFRTCVLKNGTEAFIGRQDLRKTLRRFVADPETLILLVDGEPNSGRSYTYNFLRHIGQHSGFRPVRVTLSRTSTAATVVRRLAEFVADPRAGVSPLNPTGLNDPLPSTDEAAHWVAGRATAAEERLWLVLDECDKLDPSSDVWDFIGQLALAIYEHAALRGDQAPRLVLLGYGRSMRQLPYDLRGNMCWDTARVAGPEELRSFFEQVFHEAPPEPLTAADGRDASVDELVEVALEEVLHAIEEQAGSGESYMRRVCTAAEGAVRVYRSL